MSGTKRATGDPLVSKRQDFQSFLDCLIYGGFGDFFYFLEILREIEELPEMSWCQTGASQIFKQNGFLFSGFIVFFWICCDIVGFFRRTQRTKSSRPKGLPP